MARQGIEGDAAEQIVHAITAFALLWLSGVAREQLRAARVRQRVSQGAPSAGVLRGAAQQPADGLLSRGDDREGRPAPRPAHPPRRRHAVERGSARSRTAPCGWACATSRDCARRPAGRSWPRARSGRSPRWRDRVARDRQLDREEAQTLAAIGALRRRWAARAARLWAVAVRSPAAALRRRRRRAYWRRPRRPARCGR